MEQFLKLAKELKFDLNQEEIDDLLNKSSQVLKNIEMIKQFDLSNYENMEYSRRKQYRLREDDIEINDGMKIFQNAISFEEGFVVVKSEK